MSTSSPVVGSTPDRVTLAERAATGRQAHARAPRSSFGSWRPAAGRDPLAILQAEADTRIAELVPIRSGRMAASAFAFYRGAAGLMAADLAPMPRTGLTVQLCGDAHLVNFGIFAAPDRRLVFSINDFDETHPGPFEWDVERLVASLAVAGRERGFTAATRTQIVMAAVRTYHEAMREFAAMPTLHLWYTRLDAHELSVKWSAETGPKEIRALQQLATKARSKDSQRALTKLTEVVDGERRFVDRAPLLVRLSDLVEADDVDRAMADADCVLQGYAATLSRERQVLLSRFRFVDVARKVVGVGSVGTRDWVMLLVGRDEDDPLILQFKEAQASVLEPYLGPSDFAQHGQRVVEGQRLLQAGSDILLGWHRTEGLDGVHSDYYVRQLWDEKGGANVDALSAHDLVLYASFCGWTLARAHARSGDPVAIDAYLGTSDTFERSMLAFAEAYAVQSVQDVELLRQAIAAGTVVAESGI